MSGIIVVTERPSGYALIWRRPGAPDYAYRRGVASHDEALRRGRLVADLMGATLEDSTPPGSAVEDSSRLSSGASCAAAEPEKGALW